MSNSIFFEGLGAGLLYSINYERLIIDEIGVRVGFTYYSFEQKWEDCLEPPCPDPYRVHEFNFPITVSYMGLRMGEHSLELGSGMTIRCASDDTRALEDLIDDRGIIGAHGNILLGYRFHPVDSPGFQFRIGFMTLVGPGYGVPLGVTSEDFGALFWGYVSGGVAF